MKWLAALVEEAGLSKFRADLAEAVVALEPFAAKPTISEMLKPDWQHPWGRLTPSERIEEMGKRKEQSDREILAARAFLAKHGGGE